MKARNGFSAALISIGFFMFAPAAARADLYLCDGVWTNRQCESGAQRALNESESRPRTQDEVEHDQKELWIHDLETARIKARREYGIETDITDLRQVCLGENTTASLIDCRKAISEREREIESRVREIERDRAAKAEREREDESKAIPPVTIIDDRDTVIIPRRRYRRPPFPRPTVAPVPTVRPRPTPVPRRSRRAVVVSPDVR